MEQGFSFLWGHAVPIPISQMRKQSLALGTSPPRRSAASSRTAHPPCTSSPRLSPAARVPVLSGHHHVCI